MFRLTSVIGKAPLTLPKLQPNQFCHPLPCLRPKSTCCRQTTSINQDVSCPSKDKSSQLLKVAACKCIKFAKYAALSMVATVAVTGGIIAYAKTDPELRDWLTILLPTLDEVIAIASQESMTYGEFITMAKEYFGYENLEEEPSNNTLHHPCSMDF